MRAIIFHPKAQKTIKDFPEIIRKRLGRLLYDLQAGENLSFPSSKPMNIIATGAHELRITSKEGAFRVMYITVNNRVLIFHAFTKKTQKTPQIQIEVSKKRLKELYK